MGQYIHFTEEQKLRAGSVDLEEFLRCRGERLIASGREKRLASDHSVTVRGNEWYDHAAEKGGGPVSFVQTYYGLSYPEAMTLLLGGETGQVYPATQEKAPEPPKPFELPEANADMRRVYGYLMKRRHIDKNAMRMPGTTTASSSAETRRTKPVTPTSAVRTAAASPSASMWRAATRDTAFTTSAAMGVSMYSRLPSIFCPLFRYTQRVGRRTATSPAAACPFSLC